MHKIIVFKDSDVWDVVEVMKKYSFRPPIGLIVPFGSTIGKRSLIDLPDSDEGVIAAERRHVFFFWRKEYLFLQQNDDGIFLTWYPENQVRLNK